MDYTQVEDDSMLGDTFRFPPKIDAKHLSPHPSRLIDPISVGKNCQGQIFKVPPVEDLNKKDVLYYLWFIDNKLAWPSAQILPESRQNAIITLTIDEQFLLSHFETKIPHDFFTRQHVIELYVSDVEYAIPESRYIDNAKANKNDDSAYVYWIVNFSDDPC
jgi:hypothetical protein